jgi:hypothetical protein
MAEVVVPSTKRFLTVEELSKEDIVIADISL